MINYRLIIFHFRNFLFISLILVICSCDDHSGSSDPNPISKNEDLIIIGDTTNMVINALNEDAFVGYNGESTYELDIDDDGESDLLFNGFRFQMMAYGISYYTTISCLSSKIKLLTYPQPDSIFISKDTTQYISDGKLNIYYITSYLCQKKYNRDVFHSLTDTMLNPLQLLDTLRISSKFENKKFEIIRKHKSYPSDIFYESKDTIKYKITHFITGCRYFPKNDTSYVGFVKEVKEKQKLGWIKLYCVDSQTFILKTALQK